MTSYTCAISGVEAEVPVVSPASGEIFEKRLITKYIDENGTDPVNGQDLKESQLVAIKRDESTRATLRPLPTASIPVLLKTLQDEWDACMLNNFTLRQDLQAAREELTHALYQNDAACRVINRLSLELSSARAAMAKIPQHRIQEREKENIANAGGDATGNNDVEMAEDELPGLNEEAIKKIQDCGSELSSSRKQRGRRLPEGLVDVETLAAFKQSACHSGIHSTDTPGITCLDIQGSLALTGGVDKTLALFNMETEVIDATFKGHRKQITACVLHPDKETVVSASADHTVRIWNKSSETARHTVTVHSAAVNGVSLHPTGDYVLAFSADTYWSLIDIVQGRALVKNRGDKDFAAFTCGQCHPDGLILATGTRDHMVKIWDLRDQINVANFPGHQGEVRAISFSENGYHLATGATDGEVKVWDLRKLTNVKTFAVGDNNAPINSVRFDKSGAYIAAASDVVQVLQVKTWRVAASFDSHTARVTDCRFGANAQLLSTVSMDKTLRVFAAQ